MTLDEYLEFDLYEFAYDAFPSAFKIHHSLYTDMQSKKNMQTNLRLNSFTCICPNAGKPQTCHLLCLCSCKNCNGNIVISDMPAISESTLRRSTRHRHHPVTDDTSRLLKKPRNEQHGGLPRVQMPSTPTRILPQVGKSGATSKHVYKKGTVLVVAHAWNEPWFLLLDNDAEVNEQSGPGEAEITGCWLELSTKNKEGFQYKMGDQVLILEYQQSGVAIMRNDFFISHHDYKNAVTANNSNPLCSSSNNNTKLNAAVPVSVPESASGTRTDMWQCLKDVIDRHTTVGIVLAEKDDNKNANVWSTDMKTVMADVVALVIDAFLQKHLEIRWDSRGNTDIPKCEMPQSAIQLLATVDRGDTIEVPKMTNVVSQLADMLDLQLNHFYDLTFNPAIESSKNLVGDPTGMVRCCSRQQGQDTYTTYVRINRVWIKCADSEWTDFKDSLTKKRAEFVNSLHTALDTGGELPYSFVDRRLHFIVGDRNCSVAELFRTSIERNGTLSASFRALCTALGTKRAEELKEDLKVSVLQQACNYPLSASNPSLIQLHELSRDMFEPEQLTATPACIKLVTEIVDGCLRCGGENMLTKQPTHIHLVKLSPFSDQQVFCFIVRKGNKVWLTKDLFTKSHLALELEFSTISASLSNHDDHDHDNDHDGDDDDCDDHDGNDHAGDDHEQGVGSEHGDSSHVNHNHRQDLPPKEFQQNHLGGKSTGGEHGVNSSHDGELDTRAQLELSTPPLVEPAVGRPGASTYGDAVKALDFDAHDIHVHENEYVVENRSQLGGVASPSDPLAIDDVNITIPASFGGTTNTNNIISLHSYFAKEDAVPTFITSLFRDKKNVNDVMAKVKKDCQTAYEDLSAKQFTKANKWHVFVPFLLKKESWCLVGNDSILAAERIFTQDSFASFQIGWLLHLLTCRCADRVISSDDLSQLFGTNLFTAGSVNTAAMSVKHQHLASIYDCLTTRRKILRACLMMFGCYKSGTNAAPVLVESLSMPESNDSRKKKGRAVHPGLELAKQCCETWRETWPLEDLGTNSDHIRKQWLEHCNSKGLIILDQDQHGYGNILSMYANMASPNCRCTICDLEFDGLSQAFAHVISNKHSKLVCTCKLACNECSCAPPKVTIVYDIFNEAVREVEDNTPASCVGVWDFPDGCISGQVTTKRTWTKHYWFLRRTGRTSVCDCAVTTDTYGHIQKCHPEKWLLIENDRNRSPQGSVENVIKTFEIFGRLHTITRALRSVHCKRDNQFSKREDLQTCWYTCHNCVALFVKLNDKTECSDLWRSDIKLQKFIDNQATLRLSPYEEQLQVLVSLIASKQSQKFVTGLIHALQYGGELMNGISRTFFDRRHIQNEVQLDIISAILYKMNTPKLNSRKKEIANVLYDVSNAVCNFGPTDYNYLAKVTGLPLYRSAKDKWVASTVSVPPIDYVGVTGKSVRRAWVRDGQSRKVLCVLSYDGGRICRGLGVVYDDANSHRHIVGTQMPSDPKLIPWYKSQMELGSIIERTIPQTNTTGDEADEAGALAHWANEVTRHKQLAYSAMLMVLNPLQNHESGTPIGSAPLTFRKWYVVLNWILHWYSMCWSSDPVVELFAVCGDSDQAQLRAHIWLMTPQRQLISQGLRYAVLGTPLQTLYPPIGWGRSRLILASSDAVHNLMSVVTRDLWNKSSSFVVWHMTGGDQVVASGEHVVRASESSGYEFKSEIQGIITSNPYSHKRPNIAWALISVKHVQAMYIAGFTGTAAYLEVASLLFSPWSEEFAEQGTREVLVKMWTGLLAFKAMRAHQIYRHLSMKGRSTGGPKRQMTTTQTTMSLEVMVVAFTVAQVSIARRKEELLESLRRRGDNTYNGCEDDHGHLNEGDLPDFQYAFRGNEMTSCPVEKGISASQGRDQINHHSNTHAPTFSANLGGMSNIQRRMHGRDTLMQKGGAPNASFNKRERASRQSLSKKESAITNEEVLNLIDIAAARCRTFIGDLSERMGAGPSGITYVKEFETMGIDMNDPQAMAIEFTKRCVVFHNRSLKDKAFEVKTELTHADWFRHNVPKWSNPSLAPVPRNALKGFRLGITENDLEDERQVWKKFRASQHLPVPKNRPDYDGTQSYCLDKQANDWELDDEDDDDNPEACSSEGQDPLAHDGPVFVTNTGKPPTGPKVRLISTKFQVKEALENILTGKSKDTDLQMNLIYDATSIDKGTLQQCIYDVWLEDRTILRAKVVRNRKTFKGFEDSKWNQNKTKICKTWQREGNWVKEMVCIEGILVSIQLMELSTISRNRGRKHAFHTYHLESEVPEDADVVNNMFMIYRLPVELVWKVILVNSIVVGSRTLSGISKTQLGEHGKTKGKLIWSDAKFSGTEYVLRQPTQDEFANSDLRFVHTKTERSNIAAKHFLMRIPFMATADDCGDLLVRGHVYKFLLDDRHLAPWNPKSVDLPDSKKIQVDFLEETNQEHSRITLKKFEEMVKLDGKRKRTVDCAPLTQTQIVLLYLSAILLPASQHIVDYYPSSSAAAVVQLMLQNETVTAKVLKVLDCIRGPTTNLLEALRIVAESDRAKPLDLSVAQEKLCICRGECGESKHKKVCIIDCDGTCGCIEQGRINCSKHDLQFCTKEGPNMIIFVLNRSSDSTSASIFEPQLLLPKGTHSCTSTYALTSMFSNYGELLFLNPRDCLWRKYDKNHTTAEVHATDQRELECMVAMGSYFGRIYYKAKNAIPQDNVPSPAFVAYTRLDWTIKRGFGGGVLTTIRTSTPDKSFCKIPAMRGLQMSVCDLQHQLNLSKLIVKRKSSDPVSIADEYVRLLAEGSLNDTIAILGPFASAEQFRGHERVIEDKTTTICVLVTDRIAGKFDNFLFLDLESNTAVLHANTSCALAKKSILWLISNGTLNASWAVTSNNIPRIKTVHEHEEQRAVAMLMALTTMLAKDRKDFQMVKINKEDAMAHIIRCVAWQTCIEPPVSLQQEPPVSLQQVKAVRGKRKRKIPNS